MSKLVFSATVLEVLEETGVDPEDDRDRFLAGEVTRDALLAECLDGADDDRHEAWREYVAVICSA